MNESITPTTKHFSPAASLAALGVKLSQLVNAKIPWLMATLGAYSSLAYNDEMSPGIALRPLCSSADIMSYPRLPVHNEEGDGGKLLSKKHLRPSSWLRKPNR